MKKLADFHHFSRRFVIFIIEVNKLEDCKISPISSLIIGNHLNILYMIRTVNLDESNLSITMKMADLKALFFYWEDEWAKKLAEANKVKEKQEWYNSREVAKIFKKSISTINRWKHSGYLTARTVGGMDYYSKKEIELKLGAA